MTTIVLIRDVFAWVGVVAIGWQIGGVWVWLLRHRRQRTRRARMMRVHILEHRNGLDPYWYRDEIVAARRPTGSYECWSCGAPFTPLYVCATTAVCAKCVRETLKTTV